MVKRILKLPENNSFFLFGPRQTGKSTLLRETFRKETTLYYDLLRSDEYFRLSLNPSLFREEVFSRSKEITHVVVDEVQRVPQLLSEVQSLLESEKPLLYFCLSGSSARKLKRSHANLLAGRAWTFRLYPFTHIECSPHFSLEKALSVGTLPPVYLEENESHAKRTLKAYAETYLQEEIRSEALLRNIGGFLRFLRLAGEENGNVLNYSNIARETGTSYKTVKEHFQVLEDTLIGFFLLPYGRSLRRRLVKHPKFYFFDTGVQRAITGRLSLPLRRGTSDFGRTFEHFLITEVIRLAHYREKDYAFSFYRTESGAEVDLVVERPDGKIYAIEIKGSDSPDSTTLTGLSSFAEISRGALLCCASLAPRGRISKGVRILPWQELFEFLDL